MIFDRPKEPGKKKALLLALAVHLGLVVFLFVGVQWKRSQPEVMEVELWSAVPKAATQTPPPPPPPPEPEKPLPKIEPKPEPKPPVKPDIVIKEEKKKPKPEPEPKKPEPKPEVKKPDVPPKPPIPSFEQQLREDALQRNAEAAAREQRAGSQKRGLADWIGKIQGKIRGNMVLPANIQGNPEAVFRVNLLPSGEVLQPIRLVKSSGHPGLDAAIERAILKSSPLPKPADPSVFQRDLEIKYRPFEE